MFRNGKRIRPVFAVLPTGWSHRVVVAHSIHGQILRKAAKLDSEQKIIGGKPQYIEEVRYGRYIYDFVVVGHNKDAMQMVYERVFSAFDLARLIPKPTKCEALERPRKVL